MSAAAAAAMLLATPSYAAQDMRAGFEPTMRPAAYVGGVVRLELGQRRQPKPVARLRVAMTPSAGDPRAATRLVTDPNRGIELGLGGRQRPELYVGGRSLSQTTRRAGLDGSAGNVVPIVFGVALVVVAIIVVKSLDDLGDSSSD